MKTKTLQPKEHRCPWVKNQADITDSPYEDTGKKSFWSYSVLTSWVIHMSFIGKLMRKNAKLKPNETTELRDKEHFRWRAVPPHSTSLLQQHSSFLKIMKR